VGVSIGAKGRGDGEMGTGELMRCLCYGEGEAACAHCGEEPREGEVF